MASLAAPFVLPLLFLLAAATDGWLGVYLAETEHPEIASVIDGSPADRAGLRAGDRFLAVDDKAVATQAAFIEAIRARSPGQRVRLKIERGDSEMLVLVKLGERPEEIPAPAPAIGREVPPELPAIVLERPAPAAAGGRAFLGVALSQDDSGVAIDHVVPDGPAAKAGIQDGDRLVRLGETGVKTLGDVEQALSAARPGQKLAVQVRRDRGTTSVMVELGSAPGTGLAPRRPVVAVPRPETIRAIEVRPAPANQAPAKDAPPKDAAALTLEDVRRELEQVRKELAEIRKLLERRR